MALAITVPIVGLKLGPGYACSVTGVTLPTPIDDYFLFNIIKTSSGLGLGSFARLSKNTATQSFMIGTSDNNHILDDLGLNATIAGSDAAAGDTVHLHVEQRHASGASVATADGPDCIWDPTMEMWRYFQWWCQNRLLFGGSGALVSSIYDAVVYTPVTPGQR